MDVVELCVSGEGGPIQAVWDSYEPRARLIVLLIPLLHYLVVPFALGEEGLSLSDLHYLPPKPT